MNLTESINAFDKALEELKEWHRSARDLFHPPTSGKPELISLCPRITDGTSTGWTLPHAEGCPGAPGELRAITLEGSHAFQVWHGDIIKVRHPNGRVFLGRYLVDMSIQMFSHLQQF